jgi:hypothetical protein
MAPGLGPQPRRFRWIIGVSGSGEAVVAELEGRIAGTKVVQKLGDDRMVGFALDLRAEPLRLALCAQMVRRYAPGAGASKLELLQTAV